MFSTEPLSTEMFVTQIVVSSSRTSWESSSNWSMLLLVNSWKWYLKEHELLKVYEECTWYTQWNDEIFIKWNQEEVQVQEKEIKENEIKRKKKVAW